MKKTAIVAAVLLALNLTACKGTGTETPGEVLPLPEQENYTEYDFPDYSEMTHFSNTGQYANMQGYCGWYYCYGSTDGELEYMVYDPYSGAYRGGGSPIMYIQKDEWQPSVSYEMAACFKVPRAGELCVSLSLDLIYTQEGSDDGVSFYCLTNYENGTAFWSAYLIGSNPEVNETVTISVRRGEVIYFVMSANEGRYNDLTRVNIEIEYGE